MTKRISFWLIILMFGMGSCVSERQKPPTKQLSMRTQKVITDTASKTENRQKTERAANVKKQKQTFQEKTALIEVQPLKPSNQPENLIGLQPHALSALLGEPKFKRKDPPAQVWLYTELECAFHVFLYRRIDGKYTVEHYNFVTPNKKADPLVCYQRIIEEPTIQPKNS